MRRKQHELVKIFVDESPLPVDLLYLVLEIGGLVFNSRKHSIFIINYPRLCRRVSYFPRARADEERNATRTQ